MNTRTIVILSLCMAVVGCGKSPSPDDQSDAIEPARFEMATANVVEHGERLSHVLGCVGCHQLELTGEDWTDPELGVLWTANLTHSAAQHSSQALTEMIVEGRRPDRQLMDMPSFLFTEVHPDDIAALVSFLATLEPIGDIHPEPTIGPQLARDMESGKFKNSVQMVEEHRGQWPPDLGVEHRLGRHIARATCIECHGSDLRGETAPMADAPPRPDLRIVGAYSSDEFSMLMETGRAPGDRELELMSAVARYRYSYFTETERQALFTYLAELARRDP